MDKVVRNVEEALAGIGDGATVALGGFFAAGVPRVLLRALIDKGVKDLTLACGSGPLLGALNELNDLVKNRQIRKVIDSYGLFRSAKKGLEHPFEQLIRAGEIELEVYPMGTLSEKYRAAGAGIPAFYTPAGSGTPVQESVLTSVQANRTPKEPRCINGQACVLEYALKVDFALIHAHTGDPEGNLVYRKTARNFNHVMAMAAAVTIAEVENLVDTGGLDPDGIHTPGIFVQRVVKVPRIAFDITNL
ncbi:MAG: 3-oxoacid CoA-transferase subunit A [Deltaproteobacteria bacterium]|nr:3-oxoacid CoA-transferase subunit A [Deltaproteobacteria bacterium]